VPDAVKDGVSPAIIVGVATAAVSSWLAIAVLLRYVSRHSFGIFATYRLAFAAVVLALVAARG
jgi:undecaprenyl-diphosphatase